MSASRERPADEWAAGERVDRGVGAGVGAGVGGGIAATVLARHRVVGTGSALPCPPVQHHDRMGVIGLMVGLAAYVTGLQKAVINPVLGWFADLPTGGQLAAIVAAVLVAASIAVLTARRRRVALLAAIEQARSSNEATPAASPS